MFDAGVIMYVKEPLNEGGSMKLTSENMSMGEIIRYERKKRKLTLNDLASKLGISTTYLGLIEMGKRGKNINVELLLKIAHVFNVTTDYLLGLDVKDRIESDEKQYETLLTYYRLMNDQEREKLIKIANILVQ